MSDIQDILKFISELREVGLKVTNQEGMIAWFKGKIAEGFSFNEIKETIKENNYDFKKVDKALEEKLASKTAMKKVEALESKISGEEQKKKEQSKLNLIITAIMTSLISAGSSWFLSKQISDIDTSVLGETGGILTGFVKGGWIISIASGAVGLLLLTMYLSEKFKEKKLV